MEQVSSAVGGVMGAAAPGQLPRDENQESCLRKGMMKKELVPSQNAAADDLLHIAKFSRLKDFTNRLQ